jgi:hypothetical protein
MRLVGFVILLTALSLATGHAHAQFSDGIVKIGVLNDAKIIGLANTGTDMINASSRAPS